MINKFYSYLVSRKTLLSFLFLFVLLWLFSLNNRFIDSDEYILGEYSYSFLKYGYVKVKTIPAISDWDIRMFAHHRLFTWFGAVVIYLFGWSITVLKSSVLPVYFLFYLFFYKYIKTIELSNKHFLLGSFLIFSSAMILIKSYSFRPDIFLMTEGMAILYFITKYRKEKAWKFAALAGFTAGLSFLTHLNGVAFCIAGFFFFLLLKEYKALFPYVVFGVLSGGLYFLELLPGDNFNLFINQLENWPTVNHGENYMGDGIGAVILERITKLLSEHQRFFWSDIVIGLSAIFFLSLILDFKNLKRNHKDVLLFTLLLILSLNVFGSHVAERYIVFYYGPMVAISVVAILNIRNKKTYAKALMTVAILLNLTFSIKMIYRIYNSAYDAPKIHKEILSHIDQKEAKLLVPRELVFNEFPHYDMYVYKTYEYLQEDMPGGKMSQQQLFEKANDLGMKYIIINQRMANDHNGWFRDWEIEQNSYYEIDHRDQNSVILKSKKI